MYNICNWYSGGDVIMNDESNILTTNSHRSLHRIARNVQIIAITYIVSITCTIVAVALSCI